MRALFKKLFINIFICICLDSYIFGVVEENKIPAHFWLYINILYIYHYEGVGARSGLHKMCICGMYVYIDWRLTGFFIRSNTTFKRTGGGVVFYKPYRIYCRITRVLFTTGIHTQQVLPRYPVPSHIPRLKDPSFFLDELLSTRFTRELPQRVK